MLGAIVAAATACWAGGDSAGRRAGAPPNGGVPLIYQKQRSFRIPFNLSAAQKDRIKDVILLVSEGSEYNWNAGEQDRSVSPCVLVPGEARRRILVHGPDA